MSIVMRWTFLFFFLALPAFGQVTRVSPDEAEKHLLKSNPPVYPPLAEQTRITGTVFLEIRIDPSGKPSVWRTLSGHPLLQQAAINSVLERKYQPFELAGKPVPVLTLTAICFGCGKSQDAGGRSELLFEHDFLTAQEAADAAMEKKDYGTATQQLDRARDLLAPVSDGRRHLPERVQWLTSMGALCRDQVKYDESEQYFRKALQLEGDIDKESLGTASVLANLSALYAAQEKYDLVREPAARSLDIYRKNFKRVSSQNASAQQALGSAIARLSWLLSKTAMKQNKSAEAAKQCRTMLDFKDFLKTPDRDSMLSTCQQVISEDPGKN
jgi:tetratricopeptide (TPR) repeat protein